MARTELHIPCSTFSIGVVGGLISLWKGNVKRASRAKPPGPASRGRRSFLSILADALSGIAVSGTKKLGIMKAARREVSLVRRSAVCAAKRWSVSSSSTTAGRSRSCGRFAGVQLMKATRRAISAPSELRTISTATSAVLSYSAARIAFSTSPTSTLNPCSFTCVSLRPRNCTRPSGIHRARSPGGRRDYHAGRPAARGAARPLGKLPESWLGYNNSRPHVGPFDHKLADSVNGYCQLSQFFSAICWIHRSKSRTNLKDG